MTTIKSKRVPYELRQHIWTPRLGYNINFECCRHNVSGGRGFTGQCTRAGKVTDKIDGKSYLFCKQHSYAYKKKRYKERLAAITQSRMRSEAHWDLRSLEGDCYNAIARLTEAQARAAKLYKVWCRVRSNYK